MTPQLSRQLIVKLAITILLLVAISFAPSILYGEAKPITLKKADPLIGRISQALTVDGNNASLPQPKIDFNISELTYFQDKKWVVVKLIPVGDSSIDSLFVMEKNGDQYDVRLGPGNSFSTTMITPLPFEIQSKMSREGYVHGN